MNVVLIGLRGSGKSVCGELLAARLGWTFVDSDVEIQRRAGRTIREIFEQQGEPAFRGLEAAVVRELAAGERQVLATGGGAVMDPANVAALRAHGFVVHLSASPEELWRRIYSDPVTAAQRPKLLKEARDELEELSLLLQARAAAYATARDVEVMVEDRTPEQVVNAILLLMRVRGLPVG